MKPFKNGDIVAIKPLGLGGEVTDASRPDGLIEVRIAKIIGHDNQMMTSIRKETFPPESLEHINKKKGVITLQPSTNTPDTSDNIITEKHLKSFILNGKEFTPQECPWINAIEGYDDWNYQTENEWKREGYELRTSARPVPMRPFEDADYLLLYYDRKSVFCPLTYKMTRSIQERARDMGKNSYKNKLKALEEYIEQNREKLLETFGHDAVSFIHLMNDNTCTIFGQFAEPIAHHAANLLFKADVIYGEPNEIQNVIDYINNL